MKYYNYDLTAVIQKAKSLGSLKTMPRYFHLDKNNAFLTGNIITIGGSPNPYWKGFLDRPPVNKTAEIIFQREIIFERIRSAEFPDLPSRQTCLWLIENTRNSLEFWKQSLPHGIKRNIIELEVTGKIHRAAQQFLIGDDLPSISQWEERARAYWDGRETGGDSDEILFVGKAEVVNIKDI